MLELGGVDYDADQVYRVVFDEVADYLFVVRESVQIIDSGQVNDVNSLAAEEYACAEQFNRNPWPVANA
jgi:hypothetical protein